MAGEELGDHRRHVARAEVDRGGEADDAARLDRRARRFLFGFAQVGEQLHRALVESAAAFREAHAPCRAVEEPGLEVAFELGYMARGRRSREAEALRRLGEAPGFNDLREYLDRR